MVTLKEKKTVTILLETEAVYITKSGWDDYHVIHEYGDSGESVYARLSGSDIFKKYKVNPNLLLNNVHDTRIIN